MKERKQIKKCFDGVATYFRELILFRAPQFLLGIGWISSIALWCLVWWVGGDSGSMQYRYSSTFAAQYASLAPIASALAIAWLVYAVHSGGSGKCM